MEIKPTYVSFEQAKLLKDKGFDLPVRVVYKNKDGWEEAIGVPYNYNYFKDIQSAPEQWQVIEWLRVNHGIWIYLIPAEDNKNVYKPFFRGENIKDLHLTEFFNSPQEAYSAAFDYILNKLI